VPLFVEEVTRLLLERGERGNIQMIPPTLQHSLAARLDRLGPAREVAQIGAVIGRSFSYTVVRQVSGMEDAPLQLAFERLTEADILLVEGHGPESVYRFKHSLIQDAAYDSLLKSQRQVLHRRIGEALRNNTAGAEAELLAYHFTQAGLTEAAIEWWGKAGRQSLQRSALIEAAEQLTRALNQIASLPTTPALRREEIKLQVALINPLMHVKGYAAPETKEAAERARFLIEHAEAEGELTDDPLLLFSVLYSFWVANHVAFNGDTMRALATQFLALAEERGTTVPLMMGHRLVGASLAATGDVVNSRIHFDKAIALYDTSKHRALTTHFGQDILVSAVAYRSAALWIVGYPNAALEDARHALNDAREIGQAATLLFALSLTGLTQLLCGDYGAVSAQSDQLVSLGSQKDALLRKAQGMIQQGCVSALTGNATDAIQLITAGMTEFRSTGATYFVPLYLSHLSRAYAELGQFNEAQACINEAIKAVEITGERWWEPEIHRTAGEIALLVDRDAAKAEEYFKRALTTARQQQAKSWELRAAMSLARLWRGQGESQQAHELLVPVYGWFTEGFGTGDLREARLLLDELTRDLSDDSANSKNGRDGPADNVLCRQKIDAPLMNAIV
jgi:predicted ATPase